MVSFAVKDIASTSFSLFSILLTFSLPCHFLPEFAYLGSD